ncbi:inner membrane spanin [Serratia phage Scapp]|uniref:Inner membrane spanin n=1 Tax=Serratia phage Scapp TaxID=2282409 RepID=A0A345L6S3_9CAUD|nr:Rz-like spanin [Serratia phage Scapp]AXH50975.1 inner membrane spanin [Serratia phage Scapp]
MFAAILTRWREMLAAAAIVSIVVLYQMNESKSARLAAQGAVINAQRNMAALDSNYYQEWQNEKAKNDDLAYRVNRGTVGLRVKATCARPTTGVGDATPAELDATARQDYYALRQGITQSAKQIEALQAIVKSQSETIKELSK